MKHAQRKTKRPCPGCGMNPNLCFCASMPSIATQTRVSLLIHHRELQKTTNTGRLAVRALQNSEIFVRGLKDETLDLSKLKDPDFLPLFFYPSPEAMELAECLKQHPGRAIHLIVPDGNWRQASKVFKRHPELQSITKVKISEANTAQYHLRKEHFAEGYSTLEAIAKALFMIEGEIAGAELMKLYKTKLQASLQARGRIAKT